MLNYTSSAVRYVSKHTPNFKEATYHSLPKSIIETLLGDMVVSLGDNPVAKTVIRDISNVLSIIISTYHGVEVGSTGYYYDIGHITGTTSKFICKAAIIGGYSFYTGNIGFGANEIIGRVSNYICEPFSRFFVISAKDRQDLITKCFSEQNNNDCEFIKNGGYFYYLSHSITPKLVLKSVTDSIFKTLVTDLLGQGLKGVGVYSRTKITTVQEYSINKILNLEQYDFLSNKDGTWSKIAKINALDCSFINKIVSGVAVLFEEIVGKFSTDVLYAYILGTPARVTQDLVDMGIEYVENSENERNNHILTKENPVSTKETEECNIQEDMRHLESDGNTNEYIGKDEL